jgi:hypothetical protein
MKKRKPQNISVLDFCPDTQIAQILRKICEANPRFDVFEAQRVLEAALELVYSPKSARSISRILKSAPDEETGDEWLAEAIQDYEDTTLRAILEERAERAAAEKAVKVCKPKAQPQLSRLRLVKK